jgi:hypothetical protein
MSAFLSIRNYVYLRHLFDVVHPLFWPVLYWQLKRAWLCLRRENLNSILLAVTWWGGVRTVHRGDKIAEVKPNPFALTQPRHDDPVWSTDVPAAFLETRFILRRLGGGAGRAADSRRGPRPRSPTHLSLRRTQTSKNPGLSTPRGASARTLGMRR